MSAKYFSFFFLNALKKLLNIFSKFFFYLKVQSFRLKNNFIQNIAAAGHAVESAIGPIFKHIIDCRFGCVARSVVLLKSNVADYLLFNFCEQKFVQHGPITIAVDCNGPSLLIFEEKWPKIRTKQCVGFLIYGCWSSVPQMWQICLFTYPPRSKWASSENMIFLLKSASSVSRSQANLFKRIYNHIRSVEG